MVLRLAEAQLRSSLKWWSFCNAAMNTAFVIDLSTLHQIPCTV